MSTESHLFAAIKFRSCLYSHTSYRQGQGSLAWTSSWPQVSQPSTVSQLSSCHNPHRISCQIWDGRRLKGVQAMTQTFLLPLSIHSTNTNGSISNICNYQIRSTAETGTEPQVSSEFCQFQSLRAVAFPFQTDSCLARLPSRQCAAIVVSSSSSCYASMKTRSKYQLVVQRQYSKAEWWTSWTPKGSQEAKEIIKGVVTARHDQNPQPYNVQTSKARYIFPDIPGIWRGSNIKKWVHHIEKF